MKHAILLFQFMLILVFSYAQPKLPGSIEYNLKIELIPGKAGSIDHGSFCNLEEVHFIKDCLSDFELNGKRFNYYRVITVTRDSLVVARPGDDDPFMTISPGDILTLSTITWCLYANSPGWFPNTFHAEDYRFSIAAEDPPAFSLKRKLCYDEECKTLYTGYLHCDTQRVCSYIFKKDGEYFIYGENETETRKADLEE